MSRPTQAFLGRCFLMLQGPQSHFFGELAKSLLNEGSSVIKVNLCGGDVFLWRGFKRLAGIKTLVFSGGGYDFPEYIKDLFIRYHVSDLVLYSDWRALHQDAILIARHLGLKVWVFEEGYLRRGFVTLEKNGVNGRSSLPKRPEEILSLAKRLPPFKPSAINSDTIEFKVRFAIWHHFGNVVLFPRFYRYRTHRVHNILFELFGILPRFLKRHGRKKKSIEILNKFNDGREYFFYPLQLNYDSQVQLYSPYLRQEEAISAVISSFARAADKNVKLLIKNHPLDNGLIPYNSFIKSMSAALGVADRVVFVEDGNTNDLVKNSKAVVLINSTVGLTALLLRKRVYCLGYSIYAIKGLASNFFHENLDDFWTMDREIDETLLESYCRVLRKEALSEGDFYSKQGVESAVEHSLDRFCEA